MNPDGPRGGVDLPLGATQRSKILMALRRDGEGLTRNEIAMMTRIPIQSVCLRVGELLELGAVMRGPARACSCTKRENETILPPRGQLRLEAFA